IILATKCRGRMDGSGNSEGLSRRWIIRACEGSLRRLGTDHVDLYQAHQWDPATPIEETLAAFEMLVRSGKVRYIGVSNFTGWQLERPVLTARHMALAAPVALRWLADRPGVAAPLLGARTAEQLRDNLLAADLSLNQEQRLRLDAVSAPDTPDYPYRLLAENAAGRRSLL